MQTVSFILQLYIYFLIFVNRLQFLTKSIKNRRNKCLYGYLLSQYPINPYHLLIVDKNSKYSWCKDGEQQRKDLYCYPNIGKMSIYFFSFYLLMIYFWFNIMRKTKHLSISLSISPSLFISLLLPFFLSLSFYLSSL